MRRYHLRVHMYLVHCWSLFTTLAAVSCDVRDSLRDVFRDGDWGRGCGKMSALWTKNSFSITIRTSRFIGECETIGRSHSLGHHAALWNCQRSQCVWCHYSWIPLMIFIRQSGVYKKNPGPQKPKLLKIT